MTEKQFQDKVRLKLSRLGYMPFRVNVGKVKMHDGRYFNTGLPKGFSDLMVLKEGRTYFIELKVGKNKPSKEQLNFIEQMKKNGFSAGVAYTMKDVYEIIK